MLQLIFVIISTYNRPGKIGDCLKSILANLFADFEIIIIDQSDNKETKRVVKEFFRQPICNFEMKKRGKSRGLNLGTPKSKGEILAFTDDDCFTARDWLENIRVSFQKYKNFSGIFSKVLPYKPELHKNEICPCAFLKNKKRIITKPYLHWKISVLVITWLSEERSLQKLEGLRSG